MPFCKIDDVIIVHREQKYADLESYVGGGWVVGGDSLKREPLGPWLNIHVKCATGSCKSGHIFVLHVLETVIYYAFDKLTSQDLP